MTTMENVMSAEPANTAAQVKNTNKKVIFLLFQETNKLRITSNIGI